MQSALFSRKSLLIFLSLLLIALLSFLAVFFFTDIFRGENEPAVTESSGSGKTETTVINLPHAPSLWYSAALMPYAIVRTNAPSDETMKLGSRFYDNSFKCRKYKCEVVYSYPDPSLDESRFYEVTEIYIPVFSDEYFSQSRTVLIMVDDSNSSAGIYMPMVFDDTTEYFPFVDGRLVIPESLKNGRSYRPLNIFNDAIRSENERLLRGGESFFYFPNTLIEDGMTVDEVCDFFDKMVRAVHESIAYIDEHYSNVPH